MDENCLRDPDIYPDDSVLENFLGRTAVAWSSFVEMVRSKHRSLSFEWNYYKDAKAWLCKIVEKRKTVCWVSIWPKMFKVTFYLGSKNDAAIRKASIKKKLKEAFLENKGKQRFRPLTVLVKSRRQIRDIDELICLKTSLM